MLKKSTSIPDFTKLIPDFTKFLYEKVFEEDDNNIEDGVVQLLFNGVKGTNHQFHSKTTELLTIYIESAMGIENENVRKSAINVLVGVMKLCISWSNGDRTKEVTAVLIVRLYGSL